jgi:hypothetical protein
MLQGFTSLTVPAALAATLAAPAPAQARAPQALPNVHQIPALYTANAALLDDVSERSFRFFWDTANPANGIVPDRYPTPSFGSIAAVGFGLTAYTVGVDRGYITRAQAVGRVLATLRFFRNAPQGAAEQGMAGHHGFFYHFLDMKTGVRSSNCELSTVDTALLLGGVLHAQSYFTGSDAREAEIRRLADEIYKRVDWAWAASARPNAVALAWDPKTGMSGYDWKGYNEAMLVYVLALGSPTHPLPASAWSDWTSTYARSWGTVYGQEHLAFAPHFGHQYSHLWIDFRGIQDTYMRSRGIDYFENSRRASYAQQAYAIANPEACKGYGANMWGVTASDGPEDVEIQDGSRKRKFISYAGRGMGHYDDCTMAPTGAAASIAFAPEIAIPAIAHMRSKYGSEIYGKYGFLDAFNPTFDFDVKVKHGRRVPGFGWVDTDYLGIDQGPIVAMIANYRDDAVWRVMRTNPYIRSGLLKAGFSGGWLEGKQGK